LIRIAPTPSGFLHEGNLLNFLLVSRIAQKVNAKVLLKIDDLDFLRFRFEYLEDIYRVLNHFDISYNLGPKTPDDLIDLWSQRLRLNLYEECISKLKEKGLIYACNCSRTFLSSEGMQARYPGICRNKNIPLDANGVCLRVKTDPDNFVTFTDKNLGVLTSNLFDSVGDFIIKRKDGIPAYQIASVADDIFFGITHIVRGLDLLESTFCQVYLAEILQNVEFMKINYYHHELICSDSGKKLSKSTFSKNFNKSLTELFSDIPEYIKETADNYINRIK